MLRLLKIKNFAIIDELELEFHEGFNAITGETGAGKSIILDAIGLILGNRASSDVIRSGSDEATVEALFDIRDNDVFFRKAKENGVEFDQDLGEVVIKRSVHRNGKSKIYFNGSLITLTQLGDLCEHLVDLCSQHEHQSLSKPAFQLDLLDRYGNLIEKRREVRELYFELRDLKSELRTLSGDERERARTEDFLRYELNEIDEFKPESDIEADLVTERKRLLNSTQLMDAANQTAQLLAGADSHDGDDVQALLGRASQRLIKAAQVDPALENILEALERASVEIAESVSLLGSYASQLEVDPDRLEAVEERLNRWSDIRKKYGASLEDILTTRTKIERELSEYANRQEKLALTQSKIDLLKSTFEKAARELSKRRKNIAKTLRDSIQKEMRELMMPGVQFEIEFTELDFENWGPEGLDKIQFLFSPNPGEGLKAVSKIASGGELSRVMLSIRRTIADRGGIGVYLFDEIDAGIGGQTASIVGQKLGSVAKFNQVICITHLPQVAAFASAHYSVSKKVASGRTSSQIVRLEKDRRIEEIARMLGGLNVTEKSRAHARDLLKQANAS